MKKLLIILLIFAGCDKGIERWLRGGSEGGSSQECSTNADCPQNYICENGKCVYQGGGG